MDIEVFACGIYAAVPADKLNCAKGGRWSGKSIFS